MFGGFVGCGMAWLENKKSWPYFLWILPMAKVALFLAAIKFNFLKQTISLCYLKSTFKKISSNIFHSYFKTNFKWYLNVWIHSFPILFNLSISILSESQRPRVSSGETCRWDIWNKSAILALCFCSFRLFAATGSMSGAVQPSSSNWSTWTQLLGTNSSLRVTTVMRVQGNAV